MNELFSARICPSFRHPPALRAIRLGGVSTSLQLVVKHVFSAGKRSKGWPFTPPPVHPSLRLYSASPRFGGQVAGTRAAESTCKTRPPYPGIPSPGGNRSPLLRDEKHFTALPRAPAAFPRLQGEPADFESHAGGRSSRQGDALNRRGNAGSCPAPAAARSHAGVPRARSTLCWEHRSCPNESQSPRRQAGLCRDPCPPHRALLWQTPCPHARRALPGAVSCPALCARRSPQASGQRCLLLRPLQPLVSAGSFSHTVSLPCASPWPGCQRDTVGSRRQLSP